MNLQANRFHRLLSIMDTLRAQCPWDKKQTLQSLRLLSMEEWYELSDALAAEDWKGIREELGDLLLHIVFYAKIAEEKGAFDIDAVVDGISEKLIHRHPHIYGDVKVQNEEEVEKNWEQLKRKEGKKSLLEGVPRALPAMIKAYRMQEKVKSVGFEWEDPTGAWAKVREELAEFQSAGSKEAREAEFGDLLFSLINCARFEGINPEDALEKTNKKFKARFTALEQSAKADGKTLSALSLAEMELYWEAAKRNGEASEK